VSGSASTGSADVAPRARRPGPGTMGAAGWHWPAYQECSHERERASGEPALPSRRQALPVRDDRPGHRRESLRPGVGIRGWELVASRFMNPHPHGRLGERLLVRAHGTRWVSWSSNIRT